MMPAHGAARIALLIGFSCGCAGNPRGSTSALDVKELDSHLRVVAVEVRCQGDAARYGSAGDWADDLRQGFRDLRVSTVVLEPLENERVSADMTLEVEVRDSPAPKPPEVEGQGATLSVVLWTLVPFVPLWIEDVRVDPGIEVVIATSFRPMFDAGTAAPRADPARRDLDTKVMRLEPLPTTFLDRYPFWSWQTAGTLLVPTCVFRNGRREHLAERVAREVRHAAILQIAAALKRSAKADGELILGAATRVLADGRIEVELAPSADLDTVRIWVERDGGSRTELGQVFREGGDGTALTVPVALRDLRGARWLRLEAARRGGAHIVPYTVVVPPPASSAAD